MAGEVQADVGAGDLPLPLRARRRIDGQNPNRPGANQQRQGVVNRARRKPARVPGDENVRADGAVVAGVGHNKHRPAQREDQVVGNGRIVAGILSGGIALADHREIGVAGVPIKRRQRVAFDAPPFGANAGATRSLMKRGLGSRDPLMALGDHRLQEIIADLRPDVVGDVRPGDGMDPDQVRVVRLRQTDRRVQPGFRMGPLVDVH